MDKLTNKKYLTYDYLSRYSAVPTFYNVEDEKYVYGIGQQMNKNIDYVTHKVKQYDTLDKLALSYYNNPTLCWVIAYFNDIFDPFEELDSKYETVKIPTISLVSFTTTR